jgi:CRP-like cAMP-binding protein
MLRSTFEPVKVGFLTRHGGTVRKFQQQEPIYTQGDRADELFYILSGRVLVTISSASGKEALIAILRPEHFFGEDCVDDAGLRSSTVTAATDCEVAAFPTKDVLHTFRNDADFTRCFAAFLMERNKQLKESLVDQMLLSSEKRLARLLLRLVPPENKIEPDLLDVLTNQDMIARMIGTTRSRINEFMNKFRDLGYIDYSSDHLRVHPALNAILIGDET